MTEKQYTILKQYSLDDNRIEKLRKMGFKSISSFIDLILHFTYKHPYLGTCNSIPVLYRTYTTQEKNTIEKYVNENRKKYGLLTDEYARLEAVCYIPGCEPWYRVKQSWFKGMSETPTIKSVYINFDGTLFDGIFSRLIDNDIVNINNLLEIYANELREKHL